MAWPFWCLGKVTSLRMYQGGPVAAPVAAVGQELS